MAMEKLPLELSSGQGGSSTKWPWSFFGSMNANVRPFLDENIKIVVEKKKVQIYLTKEHHFVGSSLCHTIL